MARQEVNIGIEGNDGTGDSIRESFRKVNENFRELYSVFGQGGNASVGTLKGTGVIAYNQEVSEKMLSFEGRNTGPYSLKAIYEAAYAETVNESQFLINKGFSDLTYVRTPYKSFDELKLASVPSTVEFIQVISNNTVYNLIKTSNGAYSSADGAKWNVLNSSNRNLAEAYGAVGNGIVNDTTAFNRVPRGSKIDLQGKAYLVSAVPQHFMAYNGVWIVNGLTYYPPRQPLTPFEGDALSLRSYSHEFLIAGVVFDTNADDLHLFEIVGSSFDFSRGSSIVWSVSKDFGLTVASKKTIFSDSENNIVVSAAFGLMGNGRLGGVVTTGTDGAGGSNPRKQWFVYSDNWGQTWNRYQLGTGTNGQPLFEIYHYVHGQMIPGFSGNANDWMVSTYDGTNATLLRTTDNGVTWTEAVLTGTQGMPTGTHPYEQTIVPVPGYGWMMFTRVGGPGSPNPMYVTKSTTGLPGTWAAWQNTKIPLGDNPVHALYYGGQVHVLLTDRDRFLGSLPDNHIISISVNADTIWSTPNNLDKQPRNEIAVLPATAMGYCHSVQLKQNSNDFSAPFLHFLKAGGGPSNSRGANAQLICISQGLKMAKPSQNVCVQLLDNPGFVENSRGTSFSTSGTTPVNISDRWILQPSGMEITAEINDIIESDRAVYTQWSKSLTLDGNTINDFTGISQTWVGNDAKRVASLIDRNVVTFRVYGSGPMPANGINFVFTANSISIPLSVTASSVPEYVDSYWMVETTGTLGSLGPLGGSPINIYDIDTVTFLMSTGPGQGLWNETKIFGVTAWAGGNPPEDRAIVEARKHKNYVVKWSGANTRVGTGVVVTDASMRVALSSDMLVIPGSIQLSVDFSNASDFAIEINGDGGTILDRIAVQDILILNGDDENGNFVLNVSTAAGALVGKTCGHLVVNTSDGWLIVGNGY